MIGKANVPSGEKNRIERISVNGSEIAPVNKTVDIPIPKAAEYGAATQSSPGLMSAADKKKLDGIASGAQVNPTSLPANGGNAATVNGHSVNADVPANARFTDTTYGLATTEKDGLMSAADKAKLDGIPAGGLCAYTGTITIDAVASNSPFKITTASRPKFMQMYETRAVDSNFSGTDIRCFTQSGSYYLSGSQYAHIAFEDDGITISWASNSGIGTTTHQYIILC
ncbi:MAG: hypothetical protein NC084_11850 [Bacteroides sp.]|nr:hypothetical protein [Roseburia sp.]MCM1463385.1 hypothetical protein [Bacteroides sp.]